jgi:hypothetical protein
MGESSKLQDLLPLYQFDEVRDNMRLVIERTFMKKQQSAFDFVTAFLQDVKTQPIDQ